LIEDPTHTRERAMRNVRILVNLLILQEKLLACQ
jgi:hypothetical protein